MGEDVDEDELEGEDEDDEVYQSRIEFLEKRLELDREAIRVRKWIIVAATGLAVVASIGVWLSLEDLKGLAGAVLALLQSSTIIPLREIFARKASINAVQTVMLPGYYGLSVGKNLDEVHHQKLETMFWETVQKAMQ